MSRIGRLTVGAAIAGLVLASGFSGLGTAAAGTAATFDVVAAQTPANGELNFNGADKGRLVITVPAGAAVQIMLSNNGTLPHSLQIIPYSTKLPASAEPAPAFPGAVTPNPQIGINKGQKAMIKFTADKPGKYMFICGFPGHALLGMYGVFEVSPSATAKPSMTKQ